MDPKFLAFKKFRKGDGYLVVGGDFHYERVMKFLWGKHKEFQINQKIRIGTIHYPEYCVIVEHFLDWIFGDNNRLKYNNNFNDVCLELLYNSGPEEQKDSIYKIFEKWFVVIKQEKFKSVDLSHISI